MNFTSSPSRHTHKPDSYGSSSLTYLATRLDRLSYYVLDFGVLSFAAALSLALVVLDFFITWFRYKKASTPTDSLKTPPAWPYMIPVVGSVITALSYFFASSPVDWILSHSVFQQSHSHPIRVDLFRRQYFVISGPDNVRQVFKQSWTCTQKLLHQFTLGRVFGISSKALKLYDHDNSGYRVKPRPGTDVEPHNRIDYLTFGPITRFLSGSGMWAFWDRYELELVDQLNHLAVGSQWTSMPDLTSLFEVHVSAANTNALCGKSMLQLSPKFLSEVWKLDRKLDLLFRGTPRVLAPGVYARRDWLLTAVKKWQDHARENFDESLVDENGDDPLWGSRVFRDRNATFCEMDGMSFEDMAAEDFGVIWSSTRNSVVAGLWAVLEIFTDKDLLARVRGEAEACRKESGSGFDIHKLLKSPLLQSVYAEVLRMRVHMLITRIPQYDSMNVHDWIVPRGKMAVLSTTVAHMDPEAWNTGENNEHPTNRFWAERFLKPGTQPKEATGCPARGTCPATYTAKDVEGAWFPYGGGPRMCPGRHFAKRDIIFTAAVIATQFDIELEVDIPSLKMDMRGFGLGTMSVQGSIPVKIRRRGCAVESKRSVSTSL